MFLFFSYLSLSNNFLECIDPKTVKFKYPLYRFFIYGDYKIQNCFFDTFVQTNTAGGIVAISSEANGVSIYDCIFNSIVSLSMGGAIFVETTNNGTIFEMSGTCSFNCSLTYGSGLFSYIDVKDTAKIIIESSSIIKSLTMTSIGQSLSSLYLKRGNTSLKSINISSNLISAFAALTFSSISNISIIYCTFENNFGLKEGIIQLDGKIMTCFNCNFINNSQNSVSTTSVIYQNGYIYSEWYNCIFYNNHYNLFKCYQGFFMINIKFIDCFMDNFTNQCIHINEGYKLNITSTHQLLHLLTYFCYAQNPFPFKTPNLTPSPLRSPEITPKLTPYETDFNPFNPMTGDNNNNNNNSGYLITNILIYSGSIIFISIFGFILFKIFNKKEGEEFNPVP